MSTLAPIEAPGALARALVWLRRDRVSLVAAGVVALLALASLVGPPLARLAGYLPETQDLALGATPPSLVHWLGTDYLGRDLCVRVLTGMRTSLVVGTGAATLAALVGTLYGALAAWAPERAGRLLMRGVDVLYGLPYPFIVLVLASALGPSLVLMLVALGLVGWLGTARLVYAEVRRLAARDFVVAARALGMGEARLLGRHVLPNVLGVIVVSLTLAVPAMVLQEAFFSFLGLGVQPPAPSLGLLVADGAAQVSVFWWTLAAPAGLTAVLLVALQVLGDGVRDALDPRAR